MATHRGNPNLERYVQRPARPSRPRRVTRDLVRLRGSFLLLGPATAASLAAGVILDTHGFESTDVDDPFALGDLTGQNGWVTAALGGSSAATVQGTVVESGTRGLTVTREAAANTDRRWFVPTSGYPTQRFVMVDWDMRVEGPSGNAILGQFGPFFGIDTYDADTGVFVLGAPGR